MQFINKLQNFNKICASLLKIRLKCLHISISAALSRELSPRIVLFYVSFSFLLSCCSPTIFAVCQVTVWNNGDEPVKFYVSHVDNDHLFGSYDPSKIRRKFSGTCVINDYIFATIGKTVYQSTLISNTDNQLVFLQFPQDFTVSHNVFPIKIVFPDQTTTTQ